MIRRRPGRLRRAIKDPRGESALFRRRAFAGFGIILLGLSALVARYAFLQVLHHDEFVTRSEANRVKPRALPPARGLIYDRNGVLLADNVPAFRLEVVPEQVPDMKAMLASIGSVVSLSDDDIDAFRKQLSQSRRFESIPLKLHLSEDEIDRFAVNRWRFPGCRRRALPHPALSVRRPLRACHRLRRAHRRERPEATGPGPLPGHLARRPHRHRALLRGSAARHARVTSWWR